MGKVTILEETTKDPITKMGRSCGLCWGSKTSDPTLNYKRGKKVMLSGHGRVEEFAHVEMVLEGYSARVIREWYTHIVTTQAREGIETLKSLLTVLTKVVTTQVHPVPVPGKKI